MLPDLRSVLFLTYVALLLWRIFSGRGLDDWWRYVLVFGLLNYALYFSERVYLWRQRRRLVHAVRAMDPRDAEALLGRHWLAGQRRVLADEVAAEGVVETDGWVERYPFARGARRAIHASFWASVGIGLALCAVLVLDAHRVTPAVAWSIWGLATASGFVAAFARRMIRRTETVLELSRFSIAEVAPDGSRRVIRWGAPLVLRARRGLRRLELSVAGRPGCIALDFDRVGIDRAVRLVLRYGGFDF
ncbi:MAG: hypothetical protein HOQ34_14775 [Gemmatimonadaceae bacterium]|nr:hypothetical protein [Gemmatimonadaceae bacterium]